MNITEIEKLVKDWEDFITFDNKDNTTNLNKILQIATWQNKFTKLLVKEQNLQAKLQSKLRKRTFELQSFRLSGDCQVNYKTVNEIEIYMNGDQEYDSILTELDESKAVERQFKEMLSTARDISHHLQRYIDFKREFSI